LLASTWRLAGPTLASMAEGTLRAIGTPALVKVSSPGSTNKPVSVLSPRWRIALL
jgi:hypothetical protein